MHRKVFIAARRFKPLLPHCYIYAALLDYHVNKNAEFASKIFFNGLDKYEGSDAYVQSYLAFLHTVNDQANMRVLIERVVKEGEEEGKRRRQREDDEKLKGKSRVKRRREQQQQPHDPDDLDVHLQPLWSFGCTPQPPADDDLVQVRGEGGGLGAVWWRYVQLERWTATELSTITKAEDRREVALGLHSPRVAILIDRWRFMDLMPCSASLRRTLALLIRPDLAFASTTTLVSSLTSSTRVYPTPNVQLLTPIDAMHPPVDVHYVRRRYGGVGDAVLYVLMRVGGGGGGEGGWVGPAYEVDGVMRALVERVDETRVGEWVERGEAKEGGGGGEGEVKMESGKRKREEGGVEEKEEKEEAPSQAAASDLFRQRRQNKLLRQQ